MRVDAVRFESNRKYIGKEGIVTALYPLHGIFSVKIGAPFNRTVSATVVTISDKKSATAAIFVEPRFQTEEAVFNSAMVEVQALRAARTETLWKLFRLSVCQLTIRELKE